jgi:cell division protein FtsB
MTVGQKVLRFFQTRVVRAGILLLSLVIAVGIIRSVITIWQKRGIVAQRSAVLEAEEAKHARLEQNLREATSAAFIERVAREKLGLVKEGEQVVIMNRNQNLDLNAQNDIQAQPSWKQWWKLFF